MNIIQTTEYDEAKLTEVKSMLASMDWTGLHYVTITHDRELDTFDIRHVATPKGHAAVKSKNPATTLKQVLGPKGEK